MPNSKLTEPDFYNSDRQKPKVVVSSRSGPTHPDQSGKLEGQEASVVPPRSNSSLWDDPTTRCHLKDLKDESRVPFDDVNPVFDMGQQQRLFDQLQPRPLAPTQLKATEGTYLGWQESDIVDKSTKTISLETPLPFEREASQSLLGDGEMLALSEFKIIESTVQPESYTESHDKDRNLLDELLTRNKEEQSKLLDKQRHLEQQRLELETRLKAVINAHASSPRSSAFLFPNEGYGGSSANQVSYQSWPLYTQGNDWQQEDYTLQKCSSNFGISYREHGSSLRDQEQNSTWHWDLAIGI